jgi:hypothetical protein
MAWKIDARRAARPRTALAALLAGAACTTVTEPFPEPEGTLELVVDGLEAPVQLTAPVGDADRLFIVEQPGRVRIVRDGALLPTPFLDVDALTDAGGERGLLGLAFHPNFATNGYFYVNYTDNGGDTRVVRYTVSANPDVADAATASPVLDVAQPYTNHNGGQLAFGPDGMLYVGMGDGGDGGDPHDHGENPATLLGSMLRLDVAAVPYAIPTDNPFVGHATYRPETWAFGLRNPWRFSFDRDTGDLYIADVGQGDVEEIDFQPAASGGGANYGWNTLEGSRCYEPSSGCAATGTVLPVYEYEHPEGCSVTGGFVYRGSASPTLVGRYFFGDFCGGWIRSFVIDDGEATNVFDHTTDFGLVPQLSSFGEDALGELYVMSLGGEVYRVVTP